MIASLIVIFGHSLFLSFKEFFSFQFGVDYAIVEPLSSDRGPAFQQDKV